MSLDLMDVVGHGRMLAGSTGLINPLPSFATLMLIFAMLS
jgi:hypothetical protein